MQLRQTHLRKSLVIVPLYIAGSAAAYRFSGCEDKVRSILNGTLSENGINNVTIHTPQTTVWS